MFGNENQTITEGCLFVFSFTHYPGPFIQIVSKKNGDTHDESELTKEATSEFKQQESI